MVNKQRNFHKKHFIEFLNEHEIWPPTLHGWELYRIELARNHQREKDRQMKWPASHEVMKESSGIHTEELVQKNALYQFRYPFPKRNINKSYRINKTEYDAIQNGDYGSERDKAFVEIINKLDLRVSQVISLKRSSPLLSSEILNRFSDIFGKGIFLLETSRGNPYNRNYISNRIAKLSYENLGEKLRCENCRPRKYRAGNTNLDD